MQGKLSNNVFEAKKSKNQNEIAYHEHGVSMHSTANSKYAEADEKTVWLDFINGEETAFIHIYTTNFRQLITFGHQFSRDKQEVEDAVQDL
ncbi:MAG: hypothetical protein ACFCUU_01670, partial [Cyclobacteriaceae bacterium]